MKNSKLIIASVILTILNYFIMYYLSSKELFFDIKNLFICFVIMSLYMWCVFKINNKRVVLLILGAFTCVGLIMPLICFVNEPLMLKRLVKDIFFFQMLPFIIIVLVKILKISNKGSALLSTVIAFLFFSPNLISLFYYKIFNVRLSIDSVVAVLQSNIYESKEFLNNYISIYDSAQIILLFLIIIIMLYKIFLNVFYEIQGINLYINPFNVIICVILIISGMNLFSKTYMYLTVARGIKLQNNLALFSNHRDERLKALSNYCEDKQRSLNSNFALIIGETHNRSHMSVYGYERDTTPWLNTIIENEKNIVLTKSFSCAAQTQPALEMALTEKNQYNNCKSNDAMTIVEMAQHAGFQVIWISNQQNDTIAGRIAEESDKVFWVNTNKNDTYLTQKNTLFDYNIYNKLNELKPEKKKTLYVIHLLGSHASYDCRYPIGFGKWDDNNIINAYDNSVLYNDYIMEKIYDILFSKFNVDCLMYFADHGEELNKYFCHGTDFFLDNYKKSDYVKDIVKIPVYFCFSDNYMKNNKLKVDNLYLNKDRYFTNDIVYDTLMGIMGIERCHYNSIYDLTSENYSLNIKSAKTIGGNVKIEECL